MEFEEFKNYVLLLAQHESNMVVLKKAMADFYSMIGIPIVELHQPFLARVRYNEQKNEKFDLFRSKAEVSYNPYPDKIVLQRANYDREQVFYGSVPFDKNGNFAAFTALLECGLEYVKNEENSREFFTIGKWAIKRPLYVVILPFATASIQRNPEMARSAEIHKNIILDYFTSSNLVNPGMHLKPLEFISDCFCQKENKVVYYRITATYCDLIRTWVRNNNIPFDGFLYPSANTDADGMNVALERVLADDGTLELDYIKMNIMHRNPNNPKEIYFGPGCEDVFPDPEGNFEIRRLY